MKTHPGQQVPVKAEQNAETQTKNDPKMFLDYDKIRELAAPETYGELCVSDIDRVLNKARELKGLSLEETALLLQIEDQPHLDKLLETAGYVKQEIYGRRMVLFAPLYTGNHCANNCLYCGFRKDNKDLKRVKLSIDEVTQETQALLRQGHKRLLMLCGESGHYPLEFTQEAIAAAYKAQWKGANIRRINVEIAPLEVDQFTELKKSNIGTYACFQETYDPQLYRHYHPTGPKADYEYRLNVMHRAMEGGIDDVGIGVLFGLADYRFEVLAMMEHARDLEQKYGCGPHTISVPRIEPAPGAALTESVPYPVSDRDFKKLVAVIRVALPYTGIILSTRETAELRDDLFRYGVSQISAGSKTDVGGYESDSQASHTFSSGSSGENGSESVAQFALGDHRTLDEVIHDLVGAGYIPSFCTGCYRKGRVGNDFMDLAKPGLIKQFCMPNGMVSFAEYLYDFASEKTRTRGMELITEINRGIQNPEIQRVLTESLTKVAAGERDIYL